jgi:phenylalanyl-tRNA synthetase beta chain
LKGVLEKLFERFGIRVSYEAERDVAVWHRGRCARVFAGDAPIGIFGEIHPDVAERYGLSLRCYAADMDMDGLIEMADVTRSYAPLPRYPAVERDIALLLKDNITVKRAEDAIRGAAGKLLERVRLFDVYKGPQVAEGMKSAAFSLTYRSPDRTLTDEEVGAEHEKLLSELEKELGAVLRDS